MKNIIKIFIIVYLSLTAVEFSQAAPICSQLFSEATALSSPNGTNLGPLEWVRNLKQKIKPSKIQRDFNLKTYQEFLIHLENSGNELSIPKNLEEYTAYLDFNLKDTQISFMNLEPILKHKAFNLIEKILQKKNVDMRAASKHLSDLVFRGHYTKSTSFYFLLTHSPQETMSEMFLQHLQILTVSKIVIESLVHFQNPKPMPPILLSRLTPENIKEHSEIINAGFWLGIGIASSIIAQEFGVVLAPMNFFKLKSQKMKIEHSLMTVGLEQTFIEISPEMQKTQMGNYVYAIIEKSMNWYFVTSILSSFVIAP